MMVTMHGNQLRIPNHGIDVSLKSAPAKCKFSGPAGNFAGHWPECPPFLTPAVNRGYSKFPFFFFDTAVKTWSYGSQQFIQNSKSMKPHVTGELVQNWS